MAITLKKSEIELLERLDKELDILRRYRLCVSGKEAEIVKTFSEDHTALKYMLSAFQDKLVLDREKTWNYVKEKRKTNPLYGRSKKEKEIIENNL